MQSDKQWSRARRLCAAVAAVTAAVAAGGSGPVGGQAAPASAAQVTGARTTAGEFFVEPPTLIALGFEWRIDSTKHDSV